jgi:hypothetical protein
MNNKLLKQTNVGTWWGAFRNLGSYITFYLTFVNFFLLLMSWYVLINPELVKRGIAIPLFVFMLISIVGMVVVMVLEHKYTVPSFFTYWNQQWYQHGNLLKERLDVRDKEINEQYKRLYKKIDSIKDELKELRAGLVKEKQR